MKKLLGILVLGLLWCNVSFAESTLPPCQGEDERQWTNCQGTFTWTSGPFVGEKYVGEWKDGKLHGQGTWTGTIEEWGEGIEAECTGEFKDDLVNGQAICVWANGNTYIGEWKNDFPHGQGTYTYVDGDQYDGEYKDGLPNGQGTYTYSNGNKETGKYINGKAHGSHKFVYADGRTEKRKYKNGKRIDNLKEKSNSKTGKGYNTGRDYIPLFDKGISENGIWGTRCYYSNGKTLEIESPRLVQIEGGWPPKCPAKY